MLIRLLIEAGAISACGPRMGQLRDVCRHPQDRETHSIWANPSAKLKLPFRDADNPPMERPNTNSLGQVCTMTFQRLRSLVGRRASAQGFTLIEVMVGVMLLLFAMAGIVPLFLTGLSQASTVRYKSVATNIARERMEEIRQLDYREIEGADYLAERFGTDVTQRSLNFTVSYDVETSTYEDGTLKKVTVNVTWAAPPVTSPASITTLIHQQFLGPRGAYLEVLPTTSDPLGTPFSVISGTTVARYHLAQADWGLVLSNLDQVGMAARECYMRLVLFDDAGQSIALGDPDYEYRIDNSYLRYTTGTDGKVTDVWFEYAFNASSIPDGYWEMRAVAYNEYDEPGNVWRLRLRVEQGPPAAPLAFTASPQLDNQTVLLTWTGGPERDRAYYVLQRDTQVGGVWSENWVTLADHLDPNTVTFLDNGSIVDETDPWGTVETPHNYRYRIWAVDICEPGREGAAATAEAAIPPAVITTTTTLLPPDVSTTSTTSTTLATSFSVDIRNASSKSYNLNVRDAGGTILFTGSVPKNSTRTLSGLATGNYQVIASSPGRSTVIQSFSLPAQAGQVVLTIY